MRYTRISADSHIDMPRIREKYTDYPHTDGLWPESSKYIEEQFGHLPADAVHKITCENAGRLYGLIA